MSFVSVPLEEYLELTNASELLKDLDNRELIDWDTYSYLVNEEVEKLQEVIEYLKEDENEDLD